MTWTKSGSVNLTNGNAVVYGTGTAWVSGGMARPGDVFIAPGGDLYEVASIQSNTQLTLSSLYLGSTASGQSYSLIHTGLLPAELAINLSSLQSKYLTTISQLWEWETSNAATVPLTNPATGVTTNVKPIAGLVLDVDGKAPINDPNFTGSVGIGATAPLNPTTGRTYLTLKGSGTGAGDGGGVLQLVTNAAGSTTPIVGNIEWTLPDNTLSASQRIAYISTAVDGAYNTPNNRGGVLSFATKKDGESGAVPRLVINATGEILNISPAGMGYGPGAGGTVTQATSKSTAVTLNKPCGRINMHNAALAAGASVGFTLNNSLFNIDGTAQDLILLCPYNNANYRVEAAASYGQAISIRVTNVTAGSLSEALVISFAIIKGATS